MTGKRMAWAHGTLRYGLILALVLMAACATIVRNHGYVPAEAELAKIAVGKDTRDSVAAKVGRPSTEGLLNDVGWFYVQSRFETRGAFAEREVDRQVVSITFDASGRVENIERFGLDRGRIVPLSRRVTESNIKGISFIRQMMGNLGRMSASSLE